MLPFPEELIESILSYSTSPTSLLLVCRSFYRIAIPLLYHSISIHSSTQLHRLLTLALRPNPRLADSIHHIVLPRISPDAAELLYRSRRNLRFLDLTLDSVLNAQAHDPDTELFSKSLYELKALTHIILRKPNNVYLTRPKLQYVLSEITKAIHNWPDLEYVDLAFRLSDDSGGTAALLTILPIPLPIRPRSTKLPGPVTLLTQVLSSTPKLHTFSTHLPNVWNENILRVSQNPALQRIILVDALGGAADPNLKAAGGGIECAGPGITGTGHFLAQARRHPRLSDLIRAGTSITRCRAQTIGRPSPNSGSYYYNSFGPSPSCSSGTTPEYTHAHAHTHPSWQFSSSSQQQQQQQHPWERYHPLPSSSSSSLTNTPGSKTIPNLPRLSTSAP